MRRVKILFTPNGYSRGGVAATVEGVVLHIGKTVIETGVQGAEFFAVPCLVVDTGTEIQQVPLRQHDCDVFVEWIEERVAQEQEQDDVPTLRDEFAMRAMQGLVASDCWVIEGAGDENVQPHHVATEAYVLADAMLKARSA